MSQLSNVFEMQCDTIGTDEQQLRVIYWLIAQSCTTKANAFDLKRFLI